MDAAILQLIVYLLGAAIVGLVGWVWLLWRDHHSLKVKVAEEYVRNWHLEEFRKEIHALRDVVYRIAVRMEVPVFTEPYK
jgi:hypothetical protein